MRTFALCSNKINETKDLKQRVNWTDETLREALLTLKKTRDLKMASKEIGVSPDSLKRALRRRGFTVRMAIGRSSQKQKRTRKPDTIFLTPSRLIEMNPFQAQEAIEAKSINGCSWPIGDLNEGNFRFCNSKKAKGAYCPEHAKLAYLPTPPINEREILAYIY